MINCSNCGHELTPEAKFCANCGAPAPSNDDARKNETPAERRERERREDFANAWSSGRSSDQSSDAESTAAFTGGDDEPVDEWDVDKSGFATKRSTWEVEREKLRGSAQDEWSMSDLGPPKPQRRRTWLWIVLGFIVVVVLACCVFGWWLTTDSGTEWFEGIATQAAEEMERATEQAATPAP